MRTVIAAQPAQDEIGVSVGERGSSVLAVRALSGSAIAAYGALGLPLAFAALPIYVHVPRLYASDVGLPLAMVGATLLLARVIDALTDPLIGWASDRHRGRRGLIALAIPILLLGMTGVLNPPQGAGVGWLFFFLVLVSFGYSVATIAYYAWGAEVAGTPELRTRVVASREVFALIGVVMAAALPMALTDDAFAMLRFAGVFALMLLICAAVTLLAGPRPPDRLLGRKMAVSKGVWVAFGSQRFLRLLVVFAVNGTAAAIPSVTVLFFVADVLRAEEMAGLFLVLYFVAAACSMPLWMKLSRHVGKLRAWLISMVLAIAVFMWAGALGSGDVLAYGVICLLSGMALGADLLLPASLLADAHAAMPGDGHEDGAGAKFGWWNFVTKANLALAAGLALPLLAALGYTPGGSDSGGPMALAAVYAGVPVVLKATAVALVWLWRDSLEPEWPGVRGV